MSNRHDRVVVHDKRGATFAVETFHSTVGELTTVYLVREGQEDTILNSCDAPPPNWAQHQMDKYFLCPKEKSHSDLSRRDRREMRDKLLAKEEGAYNAHFHSL